MADEPATQHRVPRVVKAIAESPWEILRTTLETIMEIVATRDAGHELTPDEIQARIGSGPAVSTASVAGVVGVVPLRGVIMPRASLLLQSSGVVSLEDWAKEFDRMVDDPNVTGILIDCHTPGGSTYLVTETAAKIRAARGTKPIVAIANTLCCSAGYHLASQADEIVASPSSLIGSIGTYMLHEDWSRFWDAAGIDPTYIYAGKYKIEGNPDQPLSEEAREHFQEIVDDVYTQFVNDVAKGRGVRVSEVRNGYGQGRVVPAKLAAEPGSADRAATRAATTARLAKGNVTASKARSEEPAPAVETAASNVEDVVDLDEEMAGELLASVNATRADTRAVMDDHYARQVRDGVRALAGETTRTSEATT